jgi:hypothetical protein
MRRLAHRAVELLATDVHLRRSKGETTIPAFWDHLDVATCNLLLRRVGCA